MTILFDPDVFDPDVFQIVNLEWDQDSGDRWPVSAGDRWEQ